MEPGVQFGRTADGLTIAFWSKGDGPPLVVMPTMPFSHLEIELSTPALARWYDLVGHGRRLVRYDGRGVGLSQRHATSFTLDAHVSDLEAVLNRAGIERCDLFAALHSGPAAIAFAARHPTRVAHLVLFCAYADGAAYSSVPLTRATRLLILEDWDLYSSEMVSPLLGFTDAKSDAGFTRLVKESTTPETAHAMLAATSSIDVTRLLREVHVPTLVMHRSGLRNPTLDDARRLTADIAGAELVLLEGHSTAPYLGDVDGVVAAVEAFLSDTTRRAQPFRSDATSLLTVLFTDIEGSTHLTARLGDTGARTTLRRHEQIVREGLQKHGGIEIKTMGDGFMASFTSAVAAVECAIGLQRAFAEYNVTASEPIRIRIGMSAGEPIVEHGDLYGSAVIAAARIAAGAGPGEIHTSDVVRLLVAGKGFHFSDRGEVVLRGLDEPVRIHAVSWGDP